MNNNTIEVIYVEDDINLSMVVKDILEMQNYIVIHFITAEELIKQLPKLNSDICILDIMLPDMDGFELAKHIKKHKPNLPIIFLSAKDQINDKIKGLKLGADDYLTKPFSTIELDLRIKSIVRRNARGPLPSQAQYQWGCITYTPSHMNLTINNKEITLTNKENSLLQLLVENENNIVKRKYLLSEIWKEENTKNSRSMDVYISKLRKILSAEPNIQIINFHGTGFKFDNNTK